MLHNIWIAKDTGECLFHRKYGSIEHDENLITSFLSAIEIFAQNVDGGCDFLQTTNFKFIYTTSNQTVTVACIDNNDDDTTVRQDLHKIQNEFHSRFAHELKDWRGRVEHFADMTEYVDTQLEKYSIPIANLSYSKLELNPQIISRDISYKFSNQQQKVISLLKYKGSATLSDIVKLMKLTENDAERATNDLLYKNVIRQVPIS